MRERAAASVGMEDGAWRRHVLSSPRVVAVVAVGCVAWWALEGEGGVDIPCAAMPRVVVVVAVSCGRGQPSARIPREKLQAGVLAAQECTPIVLRDSTSGHFEDCKRKKKSVEKRIK